MNCDEFDDRLQQALDDRASPRSDPDLSRHADRCAACRHQLQAWERIAAVIPVHPRVSRRRSRLVATLAAGILIAVVVRGFTSTEPANGTGDLEIETPTDLAAAQVDPSGWWRQVQDRDWVAQTMPAVRSVREGVAPLGRSLLQAVTLLTTGSGDRTT